MKTFITTFCLVVIQLSGYGQNLIQIEYFVDADAGAGQNTLVNIIPAADGSFSFTVDLSGVAAGFHKLYIRTKDSDGKWSFTSRRNIEVPASSLANKIISGEYYFNIDPGFDAANPILISPQDSAILQNFTAVVNNLQTGYHTLYGRFKDIYGKWSHSFRRHIEISKGSDNAISMVEYFFDADQGFGNCSFATVANPSSDGTFSFTIPSDQIPTGADTVFIRVVDTTYNNWSLTQLKAAAASIPLTLLKFTAARQNNIVQLNWQTVHEVNTSHFNIMRSKDAVNFEIVGKVIARGNQPGQTHYKYVDNIESLSGSKIYYRLQMADLDGEMMYSNVVSVSTLKEMKFLIMPNPAKNHFFIISDGNTNVNNAIVTVSDLAGRIIITQQLTTTGGQKIKVSMLGRGVYIVSIREGGKMYTQKLVVE